jgi:hypothetical protein
MQEIGDDIRRARQKRLLMRGGSSGYQDLALYTHVDEVLRRALTASEREALLLPELLDGVHADMQLKETLRVTSHRPLLGPIIVFFKRRILLPLTRTLFEYCQDNFRRQERMNAVLMACIEELAIENAKLARQLRGDERE